MFKRLFDFVFAFSALIILCPLILEISLLVSFFMGTPVLYKQKRPGLNGKQFEIIKFRTMKEQRDAKGHYLPDSDRITMIGKFLRASSLDELPELVNILRGDMSIVGPRPLLMQYLERYTNEQSRRHEVKPGLTGWAQINGRNAISWEEKFKLDVWYVDHQSFWLDMKIIILTILKVCRREGISAKGEATMPEFNPQITQIDAE